MGTPEENRDDSEGRSHPSPSDGGDSGEKSAERQEKGPETAEHSETPEGAETPERSETAGHSETAESAETAERSETAEQHGGTEEPTRQAQRRRRESRSGMSGARARREREGPPSSRRGESGKDPVQEAFDGRVDLYEIARWEVRTPLDRFAVRLTNALEESKRWLLLSLAVVLFATQLAVAGVLVVEAPLLGALGLFSMAPALGLAGYFWYRDPTTREPLVPLAATFLLSVGFASVAGVFNSVLIPFFEVFGAIGLAAAYFVVVGPIEETVKWLAVRVYAYRGASFRTVVDGVVYGAMAGVGFAAIENLLYIVMFSVDASTAGIAVREAEAVAIATQRAFVGPGHVIFSAWAGFYLGLAKFNQGKRGPIVVKGLLIAAFIHALYNTLVTTLPLTVGTFLAFVVVFDGFWFILLYRKIRAYRKLYRQRL